MLIQLDKTNGGYGRVQAVRIYEDGKLSASIHWGKHGLVYSAKTTKQNVRIEEATPGGFKAIQD